jgi:hypothetical protein
VFGLVERYAVWELFKYHVFELPPSNSLHVFLDRYYLSRSMALVTVVMLWVFVPALLRFFRCPEDRAAMGLPLVFFLAAFIFHAVNISLSTSPAFGNLPLMGIMLALGYVLVSDSGGEGLPSKKGLARVLQSLLSAGMIVVILFSIGAGLYVVIVPRAKGHDHNHTLAKAIDRGPLKGLRWSDPISGITRQNVIDVADFVRATPDPIYVWGMFTVLYGISGRPSIGPVPWIHEGNVFPGSYDAKMRQLDLWTLAEIQKANPAYVIGTEHLIIKNEHAHFKETFQYLKTHYDFEHDRFGRWLIVFKRNQNPI